MDIVYDLDKANSLEYSHLIGTITTKLSCFNVKLLFYMSLYNT